MATTPIDIHPHSISIDTRRRPRPRLGEQQSDWSQMRPLSAEGTLPELLRLARDALACLPKQDRDWIIAETAKVLYPALADEERVS